MTYRRKFHLARFARISVCVVAMLTMVATIGCTMTAALPPAPAPPFKLPAVGDATDTVLRIGDAFPAIQTVDLDGNAVTFDKQLFGDGYTLIVFWSTWCGYCMQELPHEVELSRRYEKAGLRVIGVNADETAAIAKAAVTEHGVPWLNVFEGPEKTISNELGIQQWPVLLLVGPDGKVISATQQLRGTAAEILPDGSARIVKGLDWTLEQLLTTRRK